MKFLLACKQMKNKMAKPHNKDLVGDPRPKGAAQLYKPKPTITNFVAKELLVTSPLQNNVVDLKESSNTPILSATHISNTIQLSRTKRWVMINSDDASVAYKEASVASSQLTPTHVSNTQVSNCKWSDMAVLEKEINDADVNSIMDMVHESQLNVIPMEDTGDTNRIHEDLLRKTVHKVIYNVPDKLFNDAAKAILQSDPDKGTC